MMFRLAIFIFGLSCLVELSLAVEKKKIEVPELIVVNWRYIGFSRELISETKDSFQQVLETWKNEIMTDPAAMQRYLIERSSKLSLNSKRKVEGYWVGKSTINDLTRRNTILEPILCRFHENKIVFVRGIDFANGLILFTENHRILDEEWRAARESNSLRALIGSALNSAWKDVIEKGLRLSRAPTALRIGLRTLHPVKSRSLQQNCFNLLLTQSLIALGYPVVPDFGRSFLRTFLWVGLKPTGYNQARGQRATLAVLTHWKDLAKKSTSIFEVSLEAGLSEAIFSKSLQTLPPSTLAFRVDDRVTLNMPVAKGLDLAIKNFSSHLGVNDGPVVVKIRGAWGYLDRGRGWGLQMGDRLVVKGQKESIKGHVVGFYGPKAAIVDSQGVPVVEGAIVFFRKGQRKVAVGQSLIFDRTTFPTTWPNLVRPR